MFDARLLVVIRARGHFWIATRPEGVAKFNAARAQTSVMPLGRWWAAVPAEPWATHPDALRTVRGKLLDL